MTVMHIDGALLASVTGGSTEAFCTTWRDQYQHLSALPTPSDPRKAAEIQRGKDFAWGGLAWCPPSYSEGLNP